MRDTKQVIVIRQDLKMRRGKEVAQGAHASGAWLIGKLGHPSSYPVEFHSVWLSEAERHWLTSGTRKITCRAGSEAEIRELEARAKEAGVPAHVVTDEGRTEFNGVPTVTAIAIGPDWDENVDEVTAMLPLY